MIYDAFRPGPKRAFAALAALMLVLATLAGPLAAAAQGRSAPLPADEAFRLSTAPGPDGGTVLSWEIAPGYYLYRDKFAAETADGRALAVETGPGEMKSDPTFGEVEVHHDAAQAVLPPVAGPVELTYQGCQEDGICYPPVHRTITPDAAASLGSDTAAAGGGATAGPWSTAAPAAGPQDSAPAPAPQSAEATSAAPAPAPGAAPALALDDSSGALVGDLSQRGGPLLVLAAFLGFGLLLAFSPCVLPMIPVVTGMVARGADSPARGVSLTGVYVLALAATFGALGAMAAWSGANLQYLLQSPWALGGMAAVFAVLALSSFGLFEMKLPEALNARIARVGAGRGGSLGGAAALGVSSALIMGPCVTAPLAGALLYIARTGDVALGAAALFALGLGQGLPLIAVGAFGPRILPKAGPWMVRVKTAFGFVFLGTAVWLLSRLVPGPVELALWSLLALGAAVALGGFDGLAPGAGGLRRAAKAAGLAAALAGVLLGIGAASGGEDPLRPLAGLRAAGGGSAEKLHFAKVTSAPELDTRLAGAGPAVIYVSAEWCVTCRAIERRVLPDPVTQEALADFTLIKADVTDFGADSEALLKRLGVVGPPTMIFLDADRQEPEGSRLVGEVSAARISAQSDRIR